MRSITNHRKIVRGARLGKILVFGSLGFLIAGLVLALRLTELYFIWISLACLAIAMVATTIGFAFMNRWVREPRADQAFAAGLKGLDERYCLYNYTLPAPHVVLAPTGVAALNAGGATIHSFFRYVALDLQGYRLGSLNEPLRLHPV